MYFTFSKFRKIGKLATTLSFLFVLFGVAFTAYPHVEHEHPTVVVWLPFWDQQAGFDSYQANHEPISHVSLFWYYLANNGAIKKYKHADTNSRLVRKIQNNGDKALALVANLPDLDPDDPDGGWNGLLVRKVLKDKKKRRRHINELVALAVDGGFDGIDIDYENLRRKDREIFTLFIKELGDALTLENKVLAVALHPKTAEFKSSEDNGSHAQNWVELSKFADQLHIMGYGEHYSNSSPGPITSNHWLENILIYLDKLDVDKNKFVLGLPLYAELWRVDKDKNTTGINEDINYQSIQDLKTKHTGFEEYLTASNSNRFEYTDNGTQYVSYFENAESVRNNLELGRKFGIKKFAFWRIGGEDDYVWEVLRRVLDKE